MLALVFASAWCAGVTIWQLQTKPDAERMGPKHLRHVTASLVKMGLGCSILVVINCVSDATIHLAKQENNICEYMNFHITHHGIFSLCI
jgi:hypothetical protein